MPGPVRMVLAILLTLVTAAALWWLWPRDNIWRLDAPPVGANVLIVINAGPAGPSVRLPQEAGWEVRQVELGAFGGYEEAGIEIAQLLASLKPVVGRMALLGCGAGGWLALEAALAHAPVDRLILISPSATPACTAPEALEGSSLYFRLATRDLDLRDRLKGLVLPTLVVRGDETGLDAACRDEVASRIAGARVEVLPGTRDAVLREAPETAGALFASFLNGS